jgi:hypothetical protein
MLNSKVDQSSFLDIRDNFTPNATTSKFLLGHEATVDLWELITKSLLAPWGVIVNVNKTTGLLTAVFIGEGLEDGLIRNYEKVGVNDIIEYGTIDHRITKPIGHINLKVRKNIVGLFRSVKDNVVSITLDQSVKTTDPLISDSLLSVTIRSEELTNTHPSSELDKIDVEASFCTVSDLPNLEPFVQGRLIRGAAPQPVVSVKLNMTKAISISSGEMITITIPSWPLNPYTGARGLTSWAGLVLSSSLDFALGVLEVSVMLVAGIPCAKVAPAARITSKGTWAGGAKGYLVLEDSNFVPSDSSSKDWHYFTMNQLLAIYTRTGLFNETLPVITGFGSTQTPDPEDAVDSRIYFDGAIARVIVAGDYVSFVSWDGTVDDIDDMKNYSVFADANGALTGGTPAKVYA